MAEDQSPKPPTQPEYIGDGVYAIFDGFGIILTANVPTTDEIYLEPTVMAALVAYAAKVLGA